MSKLPALHFYPGDWKRDAAVQSLDITDRGVWFEMLLLMHDSGTRGCLLINDSVPTDDELCRLIGVDKQTLSKALANLTIKKICGVRDDGAYFSRRMIRDEEIRQKRIKAGSSGGNPILLNQKSSKTRAKREHAPEDDNEDENEIEDLDLKEIVTLPDAPEFQKPEVRSAIQAWRDYAKKRLRRDFGQIETDALLSGYNRRLPEMVRDISGSIRSGWKTIRDCTGLEANAPNGPPKKETNFERNIRIMGGRVS